MRKLAKFCEAVDIMNDWIGKICSFWAMIAMVLILIEVVARYVFNSPTTWIWDTVMLVFLATSFLAAAYTHRHDGHIRMDLFYVKFSPKTRLAVNLVTFPLFLMLCAMLIYYGGGLAWSSVKIREAYTTAWGPPVYPVRICLVLGSVLLLLQGLAALGHWLNLGAGEEKNK